MKLIFTHPSLIVVTQARASLEQQGIASEIHNQYAAGAVGELAPIDAWPELWVVRDRDEELARRLVDQAMSDGNEPDWACARCGNANPDSFERCWSCGKNRFR